MIKSAQLVTDQSSSSIDGAPTHMREDERREEKKNLEE